MKLKTPLYFPPAVHHMNRAPSAPAHGIPYQRTQHLSIRTSHQYHVETDWIARRYPPPPEMAVLISTGYRHVGSLHAEPIPGDEVVCHIAAPGQGSRLVLTARTTNESRESLQTIAPTT